jgi:imidazoleglycerol-phosphate dehydratase
MTDAPDRRQDSTEAALSAIRDALDLQREEAERHLPQPAMIAEDATSPPGRSARVRRATHETEVDVEVGLDGRGIARIETGVGFLDHMLELLARHARIDLTVRARGDLHVDYHHTTEDVGIALGQAVRQALGDMAGITRYADVLMPMDEALTRVALDISGRPFLVFKTIFHRDKIGSFDTELVREWFQAFAVHAAVTLHVETLDGANDHHIAESCFKGLARVLRAAVAIDPLAAGEIPSTKGRLGG